ncbi:SusD/RagB family nutrient-binding outer membrane lipoprotein [Spirosoma panaciterrae]|uniref:SusD/RagB family nutrient-binding outer membrane lipoprotein n=1 Tax=Spirosoma panaciterrae TaxID=496058 RepID=UPI0003670E81|nr:SusD/RagB family nutrient-binding outer membrane lipoprotein [Spirosoma panaciterrae]
MKRLSLFALLLTLITMSSCEKYLDINRDPSNPQIAEGYVLLPPMFAQMAFGEQFDSRFIGKYVQNWSEATANNNWDRMGYDAGSDNAGMIWRMNYWNLGQNIQLMLDDAKAKQKWDYSGVAKAIFAWSWQTTTDYHGEIVLKEAFEPNRYVFDYDTQEEVYAYVKQLANDALTDLNRTDGAVSQASLARGDLVYGGDRSKWIKFAYGVLARNAHHISNKSSYNPDVVIDYCNKSLASNADNFNIPFTAGGNSALMNFFGVTRSNLGTYRQTDFLVSLLDGRVFGGVVDPRQPILTSASPDGVYRGVVPTQGDPNNVNGNTKRIPTFWGELPNLVVSGTTPGKYIYKDGAPFPLLTYSEIQFIKAEAAFIKGDKATALAAYQAGIGAAMDYAGVAAADKAKYLTSAAVAQSASALKISDIMLQKYLALVGHGIIETWVDLRRYHYDPNVYIGFTPPNGTQLFPDNNGKVAYRVRPRYNSEYVWNRASLDKYGGNALDYHTVEQWFSQK